jgi:transglutaminase-like putative cysteine protease
MTTLLRAVAGVISAGLIAVPLWADPMPLIAPAPAWVEPVKIPAREPKASDLPAEMLVTSSQELLSPNGIETYVEYVMVPNSVAGLQSVGTMAIPWNIDRTDLTLHGVSVRRGTQKIELLKKEDIIVLRRENNLERATLDGIRTVAMPIRGIQVGDVISISATYRTKPSAIASQVDDVQIMSPSIDVGRLERRFIVPDKVSVRWNKSAVVPVPEEGKLPGATEYRYVRGSTKPIEYPIGTPARYQQQLVQVTGWTSWAAITEGLKPLFDRARQLPQDSSVRAEIARIAAQSTDPKKRMLAALRMTQENVRYVALLLGEGAYSPSSATETWERRFGDCKGKTALLLSLLDGLGIKAEPILVSSSFNEVVGERLPSLAIFDHVIVRARIDGKPFYLDATNYGQRTADELSRTTFRRGLSIDSGRELETIVSPLPTVPIRESELVWDGRGGFERPVQFEATVTLRGETASYFRTKKIASTDKAKFETSLKDLVPRVANDDLSLVEDQPEQADGSYVIKFKGQAVMDWSPVEGLKGYRYQLDHSTASWTTDFDRDEGRYRELPVSLTLPYYQRSREVILLPNGAKGYKVEASRIDAAPPGAKISRTSELQGDRVISTEEFIHTVDEISAAEARATKLQMEEINADYGYVVAPGKIRSAVKQVSQ